jgi:VWFA-related protein
MSPMSRIAVSLALAVATATGAAGQSGRQSGSERGKEVIHIVVEGNGSGTTIPLKKEDFDLFEGGIPQPLEALQLDQSAARIALLVDNTKTRKIGVDQLKAAAHSIINELYEGDQMMVVGYDESPYVLQEFTTNLNELDATADDKFQKSGFPHLFDAMDATIEDALRSAGSDKRAIILVTDGYDNGSQTKFDELLAKLQTEDIAVYVLQAPDRTRNASRAEGPKPLAAVQRLTEGTGGRAFPLADAATAAKLITEELRLNWYRVVYTPRGVDRLNGRNLLLMRHDEAGPAFRTKSSQPGRPGSGG